MILAPLGAVSLIYNALLARLMLGDVFGKGAVIGTGLVAAGAVLIAVFGVVEEREHSLDELLRLFGRKAFVGFFSVEGFVIVVALGLVSLCLLGRGKLRVGALMDIGTRNCLVCSTTVTHRIWGYPIA